MPRENHPENLIPLNKQTKERQREIQRMGGQAFKAKMERRKSLREEFEALLAAQITATDGKTQMSGSKALASAMFAKGLKGDVKAATFVRDTVGEKPVDKQEITGGSVIQKVFVTETDINEMESHLRSVVPEKTDDK